jgi:uncharacterized membrane protein
MSWASILEETGKILGFLALQYLLGRRATYPYGLLIRFNLEKISLLVLFSDILQTLFLLFFFEFFRDRLNLGHLKKRFFKGKKEAVPPRRERLGKFRKLGVWGVFLVAALPYGGGALSGSILAVALRLEKKKSFFVIVLGCMIGTLFFYLAFKGILGWER